MFRYVFQNSFRRAFRSAASQPRPLTRTGRLRLLLGASIATVGAFTWQSRIIALDAPESPQKRLDTETLTSPNTLSFSDPEAIHHEPSAHKHDAAEAAEASSSKVSGETPETGGGEQTAEPGDEESGAAFNPETGEINWDCPCLGGMAHGPCGLQFREAFSCFVFSKEEPKGIDCVEKFKAMQDCFREHPDVYGEDVMGEDEEEESLSTPTEGVRDPTIPAENPAPAFQDGTSTPHEDAKKDVFVA